MATQQVFFKENSNEEAVYKLQRVAGAKKAGKYSLLERFEYRDPNAPRTFVVPVDPKTFETDLASIPFVATWLVPKDGTHTPAALLHDALMPKRGRLKAHDGPDITRVEADVVFRQAMGHLGVAFLRRWLMWAAVTMASLCAWTPKRAFGFRAWYCLVTAVCVVFFGIGGVANVLDLFDVRLNLPIFGKRTPTFPWMSEGPITYELREVARWTGLAVLLSLPLWFRHVLVGFMAAVGMSIFGFPIFVAGLGYGVYWLPEFAIFLAGRLLRKDIAPPRVARRLAK